MLTCEESLPALRGNEVVMESLQLDPLAAAFLCGWACADEAHLAALPETIVESLGVDFATIEILPLVGKETRHSFPDAAPTEIDEAGTFEYSTSLGNSTTLRLYACMAGGRRLLAGHQQVLKRIAQLARQTLECVLITQHDRHALGNGFELLSEREWEVCRALEGTDSEARIAAKLARSKFTVHAHVKKIFACLGVQGRKQVVEQLARSREKVRTRALRTICLEPASDAN
jgi:DNA-binding CsgD family transcriptional regulator